MTIKLDRQSVASVASLTKKAVSSAYTRSLNELPVYVDAEPHSHMVQYPVYCNTEKCWGKDAAGLLG